VRRERKKGFVENVKDFISYTGHIALALIGMIFLSAVVTIIINFVL